MFVSPGRCNGIEMNAEKTNVMRISWKPPTLQVIINHNVRI
jgi:hypothetical protein